MRKALLFVLSAKVLLVTAHLLNCTEPVKDVQYYRQLWLDSTARACKWNATTSCFEYFKTCYKDKPERCESFGWFDFVIVGASRSGIVMANRLSENKKVRVLLIEAGPDAGHFADIPASLPYFAISEHSWGYYSTPQSCACLGMKNNTCRLYRSKGMGSFSLLGDCQIRPNKKDFKKWKSPKWTYEQCLSFFKKAENVTIASILTGNSAKFRGTAGPQPVSYSTSNWPHADVFGAYKWIYMSENDDYNSGDQLGRAKMQVVLKGGTRQSNYHVYLKPIRRMRKNLVVLSRALVTKILFKNKKVVGVHFLHDHHCRSVSIKKELILSAGTYNTPQLLMLAGIGPRDDLKKMKIDCRADLPVGKNLISPYFAEFRIKTNITIDCKDLERDLYNFVNGEGFLSEVPNKIIVFGNLTRHRTIPDYMAVFDLGYAFEDCDNGKTARNYADMLDAKLRTYNRNDIVVKVYPLHPKSRGTVKLATRNPTDCVSINPNLFDHPDDLNVLYRSTVDVLRILPTGTMRTINASLANSSLPQCEQFKCKSLYWHCVNSYTAQPASFAYGTCKMGTKSRFSVVDENLLVHGFPNLRIVDDCVIPHTLSSPPNTVETMIAEKCAHDIKIKYNLMRT